MRVTYDEHLKELKAFIDKHGDYRIYTTDLDMYNGHSKTYCFNDGAMWTEEYSYQYDNAIGTCKGIEFKMPVILYRTEFYSTDDSKSKYLYERA